MIGEAPSENGHNDPSTINMGCTAAKPVGKRKKDLPSSNSPPPSGNDPPSKAVVSSVPAPVPPSDSVPKSSSDSTPASTLPILHYFDCYGRAEVLRMLFHFLGMPFEDRRFTEDDWVGMKPRTEFEMCPILDMDGHTMSQTRAILRYVCYKKGLYPDGKEKTYWNESLCDLVEDMRGPLIEAARHNNAEKLQKAKEGLPERLRMIEKRLLMNGDGKGFFFVKGPMMADFMVFNFLWDNYLCEGRNAQDEVPKLLLGFATRMSEQPRLEAYLKSREPRPY